MKANVGTLDKTIRIILGVALLSLVVIGPKTPLGLIGLIPLITGLVSFCPLYKILGVCSNKNAD